MHTCLLLRSHVQEVEAANGDSEKATVQEPEAGKEPVKGLPSLKPKPKGGKKSDKEVAGEQADTESPQAATDAAK